MRRRCAAPPPSCATPPTARSSRRSRSTPRGSEGAWRLLRSGGALSNHWNLIAATHVFPLDPPCVASCTTPTGATSRRCASCRCEPPGSNNRIHRAAATTMTVVESSAAAGEIDRSVSSHTDLHMDIDSVFAAKRSAVARAARIRSRGHASHPEIERCLGPNQPREREREPPREVTDRSIDRSIDRSSRRALRRRDARAEPQAGRRGVMWHGVA